MNKKLRQAIDSNLSGVVLSPERRLAILKEIDGGTPVKKRMPLALAIALALLLVTAAAFAAAILGGKDVVDQKIAPMALENDSDRFTREEVEDILAFAKEHGIELDEIHLRRIQEEGSYYKDELAILFAKDQLGFYPGTWSVEDQYWYAQLWQAMDPGVETIAALPREGELGQQEIEAIAQERARQETGRDLQLLDPVHYHTERSFTQVRQNSWHETRQWSLSFTPLDLDAPMVALTLNPQGEVLTYSDNLADVTSPDPADQAWRLLSFYAQKHDNIYGSRDAWGQETWQELRKQLGELGLKPEEMPGEPGLILRQGYTPPQGALSREEAVDKAAEAVSLKYKVDKAALLDTGKGKLPPEMQVHALYLEAEGQRRYKVSFENRYLAEVDALTGEALVVDVYSPGNDYNRRYILDILLPPEGRAYATPFPPPPSEEEIKAQGSAENFFITNTALAPQWYWEQLQAIGYSADTAAGILNRLAAEYGQSERYWPILYQAMYFMKEFGRTLAPGDSFPGLPHEDDLQQEAALKLAREALVKEGAEVYPPETLENAKAVVQFTFNLFSAGDRVWQIDFVDLSQSPVEEPPLTDLAYVKIDAITGKLLSIHFPGALEENGGHGGLLEGAWSDLGADGKPLGWGNPLAPEAFWDLMNERYGSKAQAETALQGWASEWGEDTSTWSLEAMAVANLWLYQHDYAGRTPETMVLSGIPGEKDLSMEQALELAAGLMADSGQYTREELGRASFKASFHYAMDYPSGSAWQIEFFDPDSGFSRSLGYVVLDAQSGMPLTLDTEGGFG